MVSPPSRKLHGDLIFFQKKNAFHEGTNFVGKSYGKIVLHGGTNAQIMPRRKEFHKMHFPVI